MSRMITVQDSGSGELTDTPQGQKVRQLISTENAPWTKMCVVELHLMPGQVGNLHDHPDQVTPMIYMVEGDPVATLLGPDLDELVWIKAGEWGSIAGYEDHICLYPRLRDNTPMARGFEVRNAEDVMLDTRPKPDRWPLVYQRARELGWESLLTWSPEALEHIHGTRHSEVEVALRRDQFHQQLQPYGADLPSG